ncbi:hypothetical protein [Actinomadura rupiterrae]|uniref:hypothetical protein n=1 Tax=Actinomadura rupiterrae TaxID=559627 RepID=UPI0020A5AD48|nr:hypothetical protein [Actinomadura rupiterrae]MCP2334900.1 hypothetical protein [Actinomadura rupiterrae]
MHLAQVWPLIASAVAIIGVIFRQMGLFRSELTARIDGVATRLDAKIDGVSTGLNTKIDGARAELDAKIDGTNARLDGLRAEMSAKFDGLRNEILTAVKPMANTVERLDHDLRDHLKSQHGSG